MHEFAYRSTMETRKAPAHGPQRPVSGFADTCISRLHLAIGILEISVPDVRRKSIDRYSLTAGMRLSRSHRFLRFAAAVSHEGHILLLPVATSHYFFSHQQIIGCARNPATRNVSLQRMQISIMIHLSLLIERWRIFFGKQQRNDFRECNLQITILLQCLHSQFNPWVKVAADWRLPDAKRYHDSQL